MCIYLPLCLWLLRKQQFSGCFGSPLVLRYADGREGLSACYMCASLCSWLVLAGCRAREQRLRRRDRSKQAKFHVLLAQGTLPEELRKEWEALSTGKAKTELVNNSISRDDVTGKLSLSCDKAQLSTSTALVSDNKLSRQNKALGKTLFQAKFNLSHRSQRRGGCGERRGPLLLQLGCDQAVED